MFHGLPPTMESAFHGTTECGFHGKQPNGNISVSRSRLQRWNACFTPLSSLVFALYANDTHAPKDLSNRTCKRVNYSFLRPRERYYHATMCAPKDLSRIDPYVPARALEDLFTRLALAREGII